MPKGKGRKSAPPATPSEQELFEKVAAEEFERLQESRQEAIEAFLAEAKDIEELQLRMKVADLAKALIEIAQGMLDFPLLEETEDKPNWERYLSGPRGLLRDFLRSHLLTMILPSLKVEELGEKLMAFAREWLKLLHLSEKVLRELDRYVDARVRASEITSQYKVDNETLERRYASLKTWEKDEKLERFSENLEDLLDKTLEVIVEGPVQLYLMVSREGFLLIFRALMLERIGDLTLEDKDLDSLMALHDEIHRRIEESESIKLLQDLFGKIFAEYLEDWRKEQKELRELFPTERLRELFVERFEEGTIFGEPKD